MLISVVCVFGVFDSIVYLFFFVFSWIDCLVVG